MPTPAAWRPFAPPFAYIFDGNYPYGGVGKLDPHLIEGPFDLWGLNITPGAGAAWQRCRFWDSAFVTPPMLRTSAKSRSPAFPCSRAWTSSSLTPFAPSPTPRIFPLRRLLAMVERLKPRRAFFTHIAHELGHEATNSTLPSHVQLAYDGLKLEI